MHGRQIRRRAEVLNVGGFSAHGDEQDLLDWVASAAQPPERVLLVHGEAEGLAAMAQAVREHLGWRTGIPEYLSSVELG